MHRFVGLLGVVTKCSPLGGVSRRTVARFHTRRGPGDWGCRLLCTPSNQVEIRAVHLPAAGRGGEPVTWILRLRIDVWARSLEEKGLLDGGFSFAFEALPTIISSLHSSRRSITLE